MRVEQGKRRPACTSALSAMNRESVFMVEVDLVFNRAVTPVSSGRLAEVWRRRRGGNPVAS